MAKYVTLEENIERMKNGSKKGFEGFYTGTCQYTYKLAVYLFGEKHLALQFLPEFYEYLYLHSPEYAPNISLEQWIGKNLMARYQKKTGATFVSLQGAINDTTSSVSMSEEEQKQVWMALCSRITFPANTNSFIKQFFIGIGVLLFIALLVYGAIDLNQKQQQSQKNPLGQSVTEGQPQTEKEEAEELESDKKEEVDDPEELPSLSELQQQQQQQQTTETIGEDDLDTSEWNLEAPTMEVPDIQMPSMDIPDMEMPTMEMPEMEMPTMEMPDMEVPEFDSTP